jgi:hypothetical protein
MKAGAGDAYKIVDSVRTQRDKEKAAAAAKPASAENLKGMKPGKDPQGNKIWVVPDPDRPGQWLQVNR